METNLPFMLSKNVLRWRGMLGAYMLVIWNLFFWVSTVTEIIRPALSEFWNFTLKFLDSLQSIATPLLVLMSDEKKRDLSSPFSRG